MDVKLPDGRVVKNVPEGTTKAQLMARLEGKKKGGLGKDIWNTAKEFAYSAPIIGDEIRDATAAVTAGAMSKDLTIPQAFEQAREMTREERAGNREETPIGSAIGEVGGAITGITGLAKAAMPVISKTTAALGTRVPQAGNALQRLSQSAPRAAEYGRIAGASAVSGGISALGTSDGTLSERLQTAGPATAGSAVLGPLAVAGTRVLGRAANQLADGLKSKLSAELIRRTSKQPREINQALERVISKLRQDYPDESVFQSKLKELADNPDMAMAEIAGRKTTTMAKGAAQYPSGEAKTKEFLKGADGDGGRLGEITDKIKGSFSKHVSGNDDFYGTIDDILEKGRAKAAPTYDEAFKANQSMSSKRLDRILAQPAAKQALRETAESFQNAMERVAVPDKELTAIVKDLQSVGKAKAAPGGVAQGLKLKTLDEVKKRLDLMVRDAKRASDMGTGTSKTYSDLNSLRADLIDEIDNLDVTARAGPNSFKPEGGLYKQARGQSGDYIKTSKAMEEGRDFLSLDPEIITKTVSKMSPHEKEAYKAGMVRKLRDVIDSSGDRRNLYDATFGKPGIRKRIAAVVTPAEYRALSKELKAEKAVYDFAYEVLGNSATVSKAIAAKEFDNTAQEVFETAANQGFLAVGRKALVGTVRKTFDGLSDKTASRVADILYETDPNKKLAILKQIGQYSDGRKAVQAYIDTLDHVKLIQQTKGVANSALSPRSVGRAVGATAGSQQ